MSGTKDMANPHEARRDQRTVDSALPRVLIADDQVAVADILARSFSGLVASDIVSSGREAIERLRAGGRYEAILCDVHMPHGGGAEVVGYLRAHAPELVRRVVLMSGAPMREPWAAGLACVPKPFDFDELRGLVRSLVGTDGEAGQGTSRADPESHSAR